MSANQMLFGCIDKQNYGAGDAHQLQLWLENAGGSTNWVVRNAYVPGGKFVSRCSLYNGSDVDYCESRRIGQETFNRVKAEELAKFPAVAPAATAEVVS
ncbi:MAG: hypothetical protein SGJ27_17640 [Candidatus Melainabacteria bacterium]|nr:hypothetical protein [Candidatus Melainabacteria bacterium]